MTQTRITGTMSAVARLDWQKIAVRHSALADEQGRAAAAIGEQLAAGDSHNPLDATLFGRARGRVPAQNAMKAAAK